MIAKRRVLLVEDHPMFRRALKRIMEETGRYQIVAEAESGHSAIQLSDMHHPDLIIVDVQLPGVTGLKIARVLRKQQPHAKIIFLSMHMDDDRLFDAIRAGASAFLTKDIETNVLLESIGQVAAGEKLINPLCSRGLNWLAGCLPSSARSPIRTQAWSRQPRRCRSPPEKSKCLIASRSVFQTSRSPRRCSSPSKP